MLVAYNFHYHCARHGISSSSVLFVFAEASCYCISFFKQCVFFLFWLMKCNRQNHSLFPSRFASLRYVVRVCILRFRDFTERCQFRTLWRASNLCFCRFQSYIWSRSYLDSASFFLSIRLWSWVVFISLARRRWRQLSHFFVCTHVSISRATLVSVVLLIIDCFILV